MPFDAQRAMDQLIGIYRGAYTELLERIISKEARGNVVGFERSLLRDTDRLLRQLDGVTEEWAKTALPKIYQQEINAVNNVWRQAGVEPPPLSAGFGRVHRRAVEVLAQNMIDNLRDATQYVGRRTRDKWRRATLDVLATQESTGQTLREAKQSFLHKVGEEGFGAFRDVRGRVWRMDAYADMVIRSTGAETTNTALINQMRGIGNNYVQFTSHQNPCEICAPLEGRVYCIDGSDSRYPALDVAFSEGYANIHANCRHSLRGYVPEFDPEPQKTMRESNRSFDRDPRTQAEKERYEATQRIKAQQRADRKQWEEYRAWLPNDTPESFSSFRRMKQAESERFKELQSDFRTARAQES